jgi:hypothetical protein
MKTSRPSLSHRLLRLIVRAIVVIVVLLVGLILDGCISNSPKQISRRQPPCVIARAGFTSAHAITVCAGLKSRTPASASSSAQTHAGRCAPRSLSTSSHRALRLSRS